MAEVTKDALLSPDGLYRYRLTRWWDTSLAPVAWVMLNPSIADGLKDDRTIGRCMGFAREWGYGGIVVVNLFAFVTARPKVMWDEQRNGLDVVGPENDLHLSDVAERAAAANAPIVGGWGADPKTKDRVAKVLTLPGMDRLRCVAATKYGHPQHPLYVSGTAIPMPWSP